MKANQGQSRARRSRRWLIGVPVAGLLLGVFASGYFLDEPAPDVSDLTLPSLPLGAIDSHLLSETDAWIGSGEVARVMLEARFRLPASTEDTAGALAADSEVADLRERVADWVRRFSDHFESFEGMTRSVRTAASTPDSETPPPQPLEVQTPIHVVLREAAALEASVHDFDRAFSYLELALRVESWRLGFEMDFQLEGIHSIYQAIVALIKQGALFELTDPRVADRLLAWELPASVVDAVHATLFEGFSLRLEEPDTLDHYLPEGEPRGRFKANRTRRRLAEVIREKQLSPYSTWDGVERTTPPFVKQWIDPYGDLVIEEAIDWFSLNQREFLEAWAQGQMIRLAVAIARFETLHGGPPIAWQSSPPR